MFKNRIKNSCKKEMRHEIEENCNFYSWIKKQAGIFHGRNSLKKIGSLGGWYLEVEVLREIML